MSTNLGTLVLKLEADISKLEARLNEAEKLSKRSGQTMGETIKEGILKGIGSDIGQRLNQSLFSVIQKGSSLITSSLNTYKEFGASINQFGVFAQASEQQIKAVSDEAKLLGAQTSKTSTEVAQAAVDLVKLGFSADGAKDSLGGVVALAEASGEAVGLAGSTIGVAISNFKAFKQNAEDSTKIADLLTTAANTSALDLAKINLGLATVGNTANSFNQTLPSVLKVLGLFSDAGVRAEASGTALKNIILGLANPSAKAAESIKQLGIETRGSDGKLRDIFDLLPDLQAAFARFNPEQQGRFAENIFGKEAIGPFLGLLNVTADKLAEVNKNYANLSGTAAKSKQELQKGISGAFESLGGSVEVFKLNFAEAFAPGVEAGTRTIQAIVDKIASTKGLFEGIQLATKNFTDTLAENPKLVEQLATDLSQGVLETFTGIGTAAKEFTNYLKQNPQAIRETIQGLNGLIKSLTTVLGLISQISLKWGEGAGKIYANFSEGGSYQDANRQFLREKGLDPDELDKRVREKISGSRKSNVGFVAGDIKDAFVDETVQELLTEQREKQRLKDSYEGSDQALKAAAQRQQAQLEKKPTPKSKPSTPQASAQKVEKSAKDIEKAVKESLDAIALAELERSLQIEKLVQSGAITHEQAELKKLESTRKRIQSEIAAEKKAGKNDVSKTLDLLKLQGQIEETTRTQILAKLQEETQLKQRKLAIETQSLDLTRQQLALGDRQVNQQNLIIASVERQQRLTSAYQSLQATAINANVERSGLRIDQLNQALDLLKRLESGTGTEQERKALTQELGRLGVQGRLDEQNILNQIHEAEKAQFDLKAQALLREQESEQQSLAYEQQKLDLTIKRDQLSAARAVREAQLTAQQNQLSGQQGILDASSKVKEAEIKANSIKNPQEKAKAQELVELAKDELNLARQKAQLSTQAGQSAIQNALEQQNTVGQDGQIQQQELNFKTRQTAINQSVARDKLNAEYQKQSANNNIADAQTAGRKLSPEEQQRLDQINRETGYQQPYQLFRQGTGFNFTQGLTAAQTRQSILQQLGVNGEQLKGGFLGLDSPFLGLGNLINRPIPQAIPTINQLPTSSTQSNQSQNQNQLFSKLDTIIDLLKVGGDINIQGTDGEKVLKQARSQGLNDLVDVFKSVRNSFV